MLDKIDIEPLIKKYKGGGTSSFHPRMLLKVLVFAYINNTYSSLKIEAALKEYGAGKGYINLIFLTFGTGNGSGLILDGKLYSGTNDLVGESGHIRLAEMGPVGFGKAGSFEGFCSGGGIAQLAQIKVREKLQLGEPVSFYKSAENLGDLTARRVADDAFQGDELAKEIYELCGFYLGRGLSVLIDILNPEIIVLGGIYGRAKELLEPAMLSVIEKETIRSAYQICKIVPAALGEKIGDIAVLSLASIIS